MNCECELKYANHELVECITTALDARDPYTGEHSRRVSDMACYLCNVLNIDPIETQEIHIAGHLHDIGKIGVPDRVLLKPDKLNDEEWRLMSKHPEIGAQILSKSEQFAKIATIILHHHERWDGKGYPYGAKGEEIPFGARVIAVCDSIDAMASARAYRKALPLETVREEIERNVGIMYDPKIAKTALNHWDELTKEYK